MVASCEVCGGFGLFSWFFWLVGVFLQDQRVGIWFLDFFSQVVEMVLCDTAEGISKALSLRS